MHILQTLDLKIYPILASRLLSRHRFSDAIVTPG